MAGELGRVAGLEVAALLTKPVSKVQLKARLDSATKAKMTLKEPRDYAQVNVAPAECAAEALEAVVQEVVVVVDAVEYKS